MTRCGRFDVDGRHCSPKLDTLEMDPVLEERRGQLGPVGCDVYVELTLEGRRGSRGRESGLGHS